MNDAGRIGFLIQGDYSPTATYSFLDVVYHEGSSYVAKKTTIGNEPEENNEYWHIFAKGSLSPVTGVKGEKESEYRDGYVNITAANVGAVSEEGDTSKNTVMFSSKDITEPTDWTDMGIVTSGEEHKSLWEKFSLAVKNIRWLKKRTDQLNTDLAGKAASNHNHDSMYYTEAEINTFLAAKSGNDFSRVALTANTNVINASVSYLSRCCKYGNLVIIIASFAQARFTAGTTLFTVPVGYRPTSLEHGLIRCFRVSDPASQSIQDVYLNPDGSIYQSFNSDGTGSWWSGTIWFVYSV